MRAPAFSAFVLWLTLLAAMVTGCASIPGRRSVVDSVALHGAHQLDDSDVLEKLSTTASPRFLGVLQGVVYDYELYSRAALQRDLARVERFYRARGYYDAHASAGLVTRVKPHHVHVEIEVTEGAPVLTQEVKVDGASDLPVDVLAAVRKAASDKLPLGKPFDEDNFKDAEDEVLKALTDRGYAYAKVERDAFVDIVRHTASPLFTVAPEKPAKFGKVIIEGRSADGMTELPIEIPEAPIRRAIDIKEGDPYSTAALDSATRALLELGVFSSANIVPDIPDPPPVSHVVPLTVRLEPNRLRTVKFGGGLEFDQVKTDAHVVAGWEDRNFMGGLRSLGIEFKPGVVLYPTRINNIVAPSRLLPEEKLRLQLKQPGFLEARTNWYIRPEFNIFPLLIPTTRTDEAEIILGYHELKAATWLERTYGKFYASVGYNLQIEDPFTYKGHLDDNLRTLIISYPELITTLDFRDDRIHTHQGILLSNSLQVAGGIFGGTARDVKVQPEIRTYLPLASKVTFATRASVGFLFPSNYGDTVKYHLADGTDTNTADGIRDIETMFFRGFFSGGPSSNRGFPIRAIAPHGVVPFLNPVTAAQQIAVNCDPNAPPGPDRLPYDPELCLVPIGGFTLWEFSNELRFGIAGPLSASVFCDMSDVSSQTSNIRLNHLHLSCGAGARYDTPVGPIRLDIGYRVQPLQVLGFKNETAVSQHDPLEVPPATLLGLPLAIAFGIGEAY